MSDAPSRGASPARGTPVIVRIYRVTRACLHLVEGLATIALVFPLVPRARRKALIARWSARLLRHFRIETQTHGALPARPDAGLLLVANHVSWLDIFVLNALEPSRFIAKSELRRWPLVGWLIAGVGTLFIDRERRRATHAVALAAKAALAQGDVVAVFPEGTVTDGSTLLPFHGSLLQPIVELEGLVQPVAIRYRCAAGELATVAAYDGTFLESVWRLTGERRLVVELHVTPALSSAARHRRDLAREAERAIRGALGIPAPEDVNRRA